MAPAGAPLFLLGLLGLLVAGAGGQCGVLPTFSEAVPADTSRTEGFPVNTKVTYKCHDGFVKIPGKSDTVVCLSNSQWSHLDVFCGRSCFAPPRLKSAVLDERDASKNYYPVGTNVNYVCRPAYERTELIPVLTCLENLTWSEASEFCVGKSCGVPEGPEHGRPDNTANNQFGAKVDILCDDGYRITGQPFIQCLLNREKVEWSKLPTCQLITCSPPLNITNGVHNGSNMESLAYNSTVTYQCNHNFSLLGEACIRCTTKDKIRGVWNALVPECKGSALNTSSNSSKHQDEGLSIGTWVAIGTGIALPVLALPLLAVLKKMNRGIRFRKISPQNTLQKQGCGTCTTPPFSSATP